MMIRGSLPRRARLVLTLVVVMDEFVNRSLMTTGRPLNAATRVPPHRRSFCGPHLAWEIAHGLVNVPHMVFVPVFVLGPLFRPAPVRSLLQPRVLELLVLKTARLVPNN